MERHFRKVACFKWFGLPSTLAVVLCAREFLTTRVHPPKKSDHHTQVQPTHHPLHPHIRYPGTRVQNPTATAIVPTFLRTPRNFPTNSYDTKPPPLPPYSYICIPGTPGICTNTDHLPLPPYRYAYSYVHLAFAQSYQTWRSGSSGIGMGAIVGLCGLAS